MEEIIDVLDPDTGERTGETIFKSEAHKKGIWHSSIHILIVSKDHKKTLLQKRCEDKKLYPNTWDLAVGGHVGAGEETITSAKRELSEELGLNPEDYNFEFIEITKEMLNNNGVISNEFVSVYKIISDIDLSKIKLQKEEVADVRWFTKKEFNELIDKKIIIPHKRQYELLNELLK